MKIENNYISERLISGEQYQALSAVLDQRRLMILRHKQENSNAACTMALAEKVALQRSSFWERVPLDRAIECLTAKKGEDL